MKTLLFYISLLSISPIYSQESSVKHQLLWEISGNGLTKPSYLFGSMHSNDKRIFNLHDSVYIALDHSQTIALETDIFAIFNELDVRLGKVRVEYDKDGRPYSTSGESSKTAYGDEDGMPQFLDAFFEQYCFNSHKSFKMLESIEFQLALIPSFANADWSKVRIGSLINQNDQLIEAYAKGDIDELLNIMVTGLEFVPDYLDRLLFKRNLTMTSSLDSLLQIESNVFCAVGAGHLAGEQGMINLLNQKGYNIRPVGVKYSDDLAEKKQVASHRHYVYKNDSLGFQAEFGSKPRIIESSATLKIMYQELGQGNSYVIEVYPRDSLMSEAEIVSTYFPSPSLSPYTQHSSDFEQVYYEGIADAYPEGLYWSRILMNSSSVMVLKAYGGNKFMNSNRPIRFFNTVWFND